MIKKIKKLERTYGVKIIKNGDAYDCYCGSNVITRRVSLFEIEIDLKEMFA